MARAELDKGGISIEPITSRRMNEGQVFLDGDADLQLGV